MRTHISHLYTRTQTHIHIYTHAGTHTFTQPYIHTQKLNVCPRLFLTNLSAHNSDKLDIFAHNVPPAYVAELKQHGWPSQKYNSMNDWVNVSGLCRVSGICFGKGLSCCKRVLSSVGFGYGLVKVCGVYYGLSGCQWVFLWCNRSVCMSSNGMDVLIGRTMPGMIDCLHYWLLYISFKLLCKDSSSAYNCFSALLLCPYTYQGTSGVLKNLRFSLTPKFFCAGHPQLVSSKVYLSKGGLAY